MNINAFINIKTGYDREAIEACNTL